MTTFFFDAAAVTVWRLKNAMSPASFHGKSPFLPIPNVDAVAATMTEKCFILIQRAFQVSVSRQGGVMLKAVDTERHDRVTTNKLFEFNLIIQKNFTGNEIRIRNMDDAG